MTKLLKVAMVVVGALVMSVSMAQEVTKPVETKFWTLGYPSDETVRVGSKRACDLVGGAIQSIGYGGKKGAYSTFEVRCAVPLKASVDVACREDYTRCPYLGNVGQVPDFEVLVEELPDHGG